MKREKQEKNSSLGACERCGRLVVLTKFTLCYRCRKNEKLEVERALAYLKEHKGATLNSIAQATGVDPSLVLKLIQGGRMEKSSRDKLDQPDEDY